MKNKQETKIRQRPRGLDQDVMRDWVSWHHCSRVRRNAAATVEDALGDVIGMGPSILFTVHHQQRFKRVPINVLERILLVCEC